MLRVGERGKKERGILERLKDCASRRGFHVAGKIIFREELEPIFDGARKENFREFERGIFDIEFNWKEGKIEARTTFKKGIIIVNAITMRIQDAGRRNERCCGGGRLCLVSVHPAGVWPQAGQVNHKSHYASMFSLAASPLSSLSPYPWFI